VQEFSPEWFFTIVVSELLDGQLQLFFIALVHGVTQVICLVSLLSHYKVNHLFKIVR
jgi:hypothetical protein